jgi:arsenate reductase-like glutaredoxin family protein
MTAAGLDPHVQDVRADGLSGDDIAAILAAFGDKAVNRASTTWRGLSDEDKARDPSDLLAEHPTLLKRPVIVSDGVWYQGWSAAVKASVIG